MSMTMDDYIRAGVSGGVLAGLAWYMSGGTQPTQELLTVAGLQAVSTLVSDRVHLMLMIYPSHITGALGTGAAYAGMRYALKGEQAQQDITMNVGYAAATDYAARFATDALVTAKNVVGGVAAEDANDNWDDM